MTESKDQSPNQPMPFPRCNTCLWWGHLEKKRTRIAGGLEQADCKLDPVPISKSSSDYCSHHPAFQPQGMADVMMGKTVIITENAKEPPASKVEEKPEPEKAVKPVKPKPQKKVTKKPAKPTKR